MSKQYYKTSTQTIDLGLVEAIVCEQHCVGDDAGRTWWEFEYQIAMKSGAVLKVTNKKGGLIKQYNEYLEEE